VVAEEAAVVEAAVMAPAIAQSELGETSLLALMVRRQEIVLLICPVVVPKHAQTIHKLFLVTLPVVMILIVVALSERGETLVLVLMERRQGLVLLLSLLAVSKFAQTTHKLLLVILLLVVMQLVVTQ